MAPSMPTPTPVPAPGQEAIATNYQAADPFGSPLGALLKYGTYKAFQNPDILKKAPELLKTLFSSSGAGGSGLAQTSLGTPMPAFSSVIGPDVAPYAPGVSQMLESAGSSGIPMANVPGAPTGIYSLMNMPAGAGMGSYVLPGLGALGGLAGMYGATKAGNKKAGVGQGAVSGALAGASIAGPWGALVGGLAGAGMGLMAHKTTKQRTTERYGGLGQNLPIRLSTMKYNKLIDQGAEESLAGADTWDIGDDKAAAPLDLMTRGYGVLQTFGPEWAGYDPKRRENIVRALVDNDLINSKQGDWLVTDANKAKEIAAGIK